MEVIPPGRDTGLPAFCAAAKLAAPVVSTAMMRTSCPWGDEAAAQKVRKHEKASARARVRQADMQTETEAKLSQR